MSTISIQEFQRDPMSILNRVAAGEAFLLFRDDCAVAEIKPVPKANGDLRPYGLAAGEFEVPADFDTPLPTEVIEDFEGR